ncbi:MAG: protein-export chaperone SecB [Rickettsiaceae bacterium]|nr:protein-export chaperone SecB [Rickettsiaceae bacterium]
MSNLNSTKPNSSKPNEEQTPRVSIITQYIKDLSIENPEAPASIAKLSGTPSVDLALDLDVVRLKESSSTYEVVLKIEATAKHEAMVLFVFELEYAGIFELENIPEDQIEPVLAVHCPNMIFPFARRIVSDITGETGFQPLRIDPVDFGRLYQSKLDKKLHPQA